MSPQARGRLSPWQSARHCLFDHVAIATAVQFGVYGPEYADRNESCDKALHLEIPSGSFSFVASLSKNRPTLNQWLRLIAVGRSVGSGVIGAAASMEADAIVIRATLRTTAERVDAPMSFSGQNEICTKGK
jgi:hypothetical protein